MEEVGVFLKVEEVFVKEEPHEDEEISVTIEEDVLSRWSHNLDRRT